MKRIVQQFGTDTIAVIEDDIGHFLRWKASGRSGYRWSGRTERSWRNLRDNISKYQKIHSQFPEITFQRFENGSVVLRRMLLEGKLDCAIFPDEMADQEYFDKVPIARARYVCCVGKQHPLAGASSVTVEQLADEPFVILDSSFANNQYVHRLFARYGLTPKVIMETSQFATIIEMVSAGHAISFAYQSYVELHPELLAGIPVEDDTDRQVISLMWMRERYLLGDLNKIITYVRAAEKQ